MSHAFDEPAEWLEQATIDPEIGRLRPDYRALLIIAEGLRPGPSDQRSEQMLSLAEKHAATLLEDGVPRHLALSPLDEPALREAGDDLINALEAGSPCARTAVRIPTSR